VRLLITQQQQQQQANSVLHSVVVYMHQMGNCDVMIIASSTTTRRAINHRTRPGDATRKLIVDFYSLGRLVHTELKKKSRRVIDSLIQSLCELLGTDCGRSVVTWRIKKSPKNESNERRSYQ
jgi:hypothetical protein